MAGVAPFWDQDEGTQVAIGEYGIPDHPTTLAITEACPNRALLMGGDA
jgi:hypothetical protein